MVRMSYVGPDTVTDSQIRQWFQDAIALLLATL